MRVIPAALALAAAFPALAAQDAGCKGNPGLTGRCYEQWGSIGLTADAALALGPATSGERRLLVRAAPGSEHDIPLNVSDALWDDLQASVAGQFEVCPVPRDPSYPDEQAICVERSISPLQINHGSTYRPKPYP
jgi:hypothetical protein